MKAFDITWDTDSTEKLNSLPKEIEIPDGMVDVNEVADYLHDVTGCYHKSFTLA